MKKDVAYFNNSLMDPRRPGPMEGQAAKPPGPPAAPPHRMAPGFGAHPPVRGYAPPLPSTPQFRPEPGILNCYII